MSYQNNDENLKLTDLYRIAIETRNMEIKLFWERSNYFLVLQTAVAIGFFSLEDRGYGVPLSLFGVLSAWLWFRVNLGSKFWQSRWERRLFKIEEKLLPRPKPETNEAHSDGNDASTQSVDGVERLFSASWEEIQQDVDEDLKDDFEKLRRNKLKLGSRIIAIFSKEKLNELIKQKPSVSRAMIQLPIVFMILWAVLCIISAISLFNPPPTA